MLETSSQVWRDLFLDIGLSKSGTVVEVAPGYEPKIGSALADIGFRGTIYLIEPDQIAIKELSEIYGRTLPNAKVIMVSRAMQNIVVGRDIPKTVDTVLASHPFDDMVIASIVSDKNFFTEEKRGGKRLTPKIKKIYDSLVDDDYARGIEDVFRAWDSFLTKARPRYFIASQYPSTTLTLKGLTRRQNSGYAILKRLKKNFSGKRLSNLSFNQSLGPKANPKWWIVAKL